MENLKTLRKEELSETNGGTFAWDAGWLLGNIIAGNFSTTPGTVDAVMDYWIHYNT